MTENKQCCGGGNCQEEFDCDTEAFMPCGLEDLVPNSFMEIYDPVQDKVVERTFSDFEGKWTVLVFYPADFTFVCPTELRDLNNKYDEICKYNAEVLVVSTDTVFSHKRWVETEPLLKGFKVPMVADRTQELALMFNALNDETGNAERATIVISPEGIVKSIEMTTEPLGRNAAELARKMKALDYMTKHPGVACQASWSQETDVQLKPGIDIAGKVGEVVK